MRRFLTLVISAVLTVFAFPTTFTFAQDATAPFDGATSPATRRQEREQRIDNREQKMGERKAQIQAKRTEKQKQIVERMKQKLSAVIDRMNNIAAKLREHIAKIRFRAAELSTNRGADVSKIESALQEAEKHIGLAETEINNVKSKLAELDETDKPRDVAQTFRTGVQSVHSHFKEARTNLSQALKALREAAKESRPTRPAED